MEELTSEQKVALLRTLAKEFKERWAQYKDGGLPYEDQFNSWEKDGYQWKWEVNNRYNMIYLATVFRRDDDWDNATFSICTSIEGEPFIKIETPATDEALDGATKSLVEWIKKEILVKFKDDDIDTHIFVPN